MVQQLPQQDAAKPATARGKNTTARYMEMTSTATARSRVTSAPITSSSSSQKKRVKASEAPTSMNRSLSERTRVKTVPLSQTTGNRAKAPETSVTSKSSSSQPRAVTKATRSASGPSTVRKVVPLKLDPATEAPVPVPSANGAALQPKASTSPPPTPSLTIDPLQIAAQLYPWIYMSASLSTAFQVAESSAKSALENREKELENEEADIADQRVRYETERLVAFYDELFTEKFRTRAPSIMRTFLRHGDECTHATASALKLAQQTQNEIFDYECPTQIYDDTLVKLDVLLTEAANLETSINQLQPTDPLEVDQHSLVLSVFASCLPVIRGRISNICMAQELVLSSKENTALALQMDSLGL